MDANFPVDTVDTQEPNDVPDEILKAIEKAEKKNTRAIDSEGFGSSDLGIALSNRYIGTLSEHIQKALKAHHGNSANAALERVAGKLNPEVIALCGLSSTIHSVATSMAATDAFVFAGKALAAECWAAGLTVQDPKLAARIDKEARKGRSTVKYRQRAASSFAKRHGYSVKHWDQASLVYAGNWLIDLVVTGLPEVFTWYDLGDGKTKALTIAEGALKDAEQAVAETILRRPVFLPLTKCPQPWEGFTRQSDDARISYHAPFMRTMYGDVAAAAKAAIASGQMKPALDAVTALQSVPWRINESVLRTIQACYDRNIHIEGLPSLSDIPVPPKPRNWEDMSDAEKTAWKVRASEVHAQNRVLVSDRLSFKEDMETARKLAGAPFWTPMNCDWRGRVYAHCHFNFQREDRVRALFLFDQGMPIGEEGLYWLKVHVANCYGLDKKTLEERVRWVDQNRQNILNVWLAPLAKHALDFWAQSDKPFLFLAAAMELSNALIAGPSYVTKLPVSFDGSCSGLQHLALLTRDEETARLVNLTDNAVPSDVYQVIADGVSKTVKEDISKEHFRYNKKTKETERDTDTPKIASLFDKYGVSRKVAKRNTMTFCYSSREFGMKKQQQEDLIDDLQRKVLKGELPEHPFDPYHRGYKMNNGDEGPSKAASYIAKRIYAEIESRVAKPAEAMKFLRAIAQALAHEGKPVRWITPAGIPWINRYHKPVTRRLKLYMHDRGVRLPYKPTVATGSEKAVHKEKAANGIAPNVVHALDAAHLLLSVNAAVAAGINAIATVHDSFGCLAPQAAAFNKIIRAELVRMYETHDVLSEILNQARCDLEQHHWARLPSVPQTGTFNLKEIHNATYAFA